MDGSTENKDHHAIYRNQTLQRHQIRLLTISSKVTDENDDVLRCDLETVDLYDPLSQDQTESKFGSEPSTPYTALSYTWGNGEIKADIEVDGEVFEATTNLEDALKHFRTQDPIPKLWVDAICINQDHDDEKMEQVQLMQKIFGEAEKTWVWLGPAENESSKAVDLINELANVYSNSCREGRTDPESADTTLWPSLRSQGHEDSLFALDHLLARDYWYRVWIVQEIAVSKNLVLFCGDREFLWDSLLFTAYLLNLQVEAREVVQERQSGNKYTRGLLGGIQRILSIQSVRHDVQDSLKKNQPDSLLFLLSNHRSTGASNQRDKYIALAGLADIDHANDNLYGKKEGNVYITACETLTKEQRHKPLDFLDCAGLPRNFPMPSWVPDWSVPDSSKDDWLVTQGRAVPLLYWDLATKKEEGFVAFNAPDETNRFKDPTFSIHRENPKNEKSEEPVEASLLAQGFTVDLIKEVNTAQKSPVELTGDHTPMNSTRNNNPKYPSRQDLADALWRCLVLNRAHAGGREVPENWGDIFYQYVAKPRNSSSSSSPYQEWYDRSKHFKVCGLTLEDLTQEWRRTTSERVYGMDELAEFKTAFTNALGYRRLASTEKGRLCLVPLDAKAGDVVAVLADCSVPVLLRQGESEDISYEFIGTCYVHGIMYGEAVKGLDVETRFSEKFDIR